MSKSKLLRIASVLSAPALVLAMSTQASAADTYVHLDDRASMQHVDDGDHFRVWDYHADGHGVRGYLQAGYASWTPVHTSYNGGGAGTYSEFTRDVVSVYQYRMKVCLVDGIEDTSPGPCSDWLIFRE
jgi:predicted lipoprotein with Yx(FWY)xxD motif